MSIRQIARQFGHSRTTVRHALGHAEPHPEPLTRNRSAPLLGPFQAIIEGMVAAFEFFGAVPREVWWDNPKAVATLILRGRERRLHPRYAALASHYAFDPKFCMPARGNEKPDAEGTVKAVQRRFATPVPRVVDLDELNRSLRRWCEAERDRVVCSLAGPFTIKDRLAEDLASASPLPGHRFEPC